MKKMERWRKKKNDFLFDHYVLSSVLKNGKQFFIAIIAAALFAFGFCSFVTPYAGSDAPFTIVTGGVSGISQNIALVIQLTTGKAVGGNTIQAISYFALNLPILIFAFFMVGKRFSIFTLVNVAASSGFIALFSVSKGIGQTMAAISFIESSVMTRVILAGVCTGLSSALAYRGDLSCGGIDVFTYYFALRKSTSVGKYGVAVNGVIVSLYAILLISKDASKWELGVISLIFSIVYLMSVALVIDAINLRNKKVQVAIVTKDQNVSHILIANFPHGATEVSGHGVYSGAEETVIYMIVSSYEVNKVCALAKRADPHAFITVTPLVQVYGNFFIKPVE